MSIQHVRPLDVSCAWMRLTVSCSAQESETAMRSVQRNEEKDPISTV